MHVHLPTWEKSSAQKCLKEEKKFRPDMSAKKNVHIPLRYDKIQTKKIGIKEEKSKERDKIKEIKKEDSRLSEIEIVQYIFFTFIYHYCCFGNKQVSLAFTFVFIVYPTISYIF